MSTLLPPGASPTGGGAERRMTVPNPLSRPDPRSSKPPVSFSDERSITAPPTIGDVPSKGRPTVPLAELPQAKASEPPTEPEDAASGQKRGSSRTPRTDQHNAAIGASLRRYYETHSPPPREEYSTKIAVSDDSIVDITRLSAGEIYTTINRLVERVEETTPSTTKPHAYVEALSHSVQGRINGRMQREVLSGIAGTDQAADHAARTALIVLNAKTILTAVNRTMINFEIPEEQRDVLTQRALHAVYTQAPTIQHRAQDENVNRIATHVNNVVRDALRPPAPPRERPQPKRIEYVQPVTKSEFSDREVRRLLADVTSEVTGSAADYQRLRNDAPSTEIETGLRQLVDKFNRRAQEQFETPEISHPERERINRLGKFLDGLVQGMDKQELITHVGTSRNYYGFTYQTLVDFLTSDPE